MMTSFSEKLAHFSEALARHAVGGFRICNKEEHEARKAICDTCEHFGGDHCKACGCSCVGIYFNKLLWATEACPLGKWMPIDPHPTGTGLPPGLKS